MWRGLTFKYNRLNLLSEVWHGDTLKVRYLYGSDGRKLRMESGDGRLCRDYVGGIVYTCTAGSAPRLELYDDSDFQLAFDGVRYKLTDHLGSVRALVDESGMLLQESDYYPFGSRIDRSSCDSVPNRYLFSGKELQDWLDFNTYDFGARMYDASLCRWLSVDPMSEKYVNLSPYNYCVNNPLVYVDPNGMDWFRNIHGEMQYYHEADWRGFGSPLRFAFDMNLEWLGLTYETPYAFYRMDGSILFKDEADAYAEMYTQTMVTGNESMCLLLTNGKVLVLPSYKNEPNEVDFSNYGYKIQGSNLVDKSGELWIILGTAHTHPIGSDQQISNTDFDFAREGIPNKPLYVFLMEKDDIRMAFGWKETKKWAESSLRMISPTFTLTSVLQHTNSLIKLSRDIIENN